MKLLSRVQLFETPWTVAQQALKRVCTKCVYGEVPQQFTQHGCPAKTFLEKGTGFLLQSDLGVLSQSELIHFDHCLYQPPPP